MNKNPLIGGSICAVVLLVLASLTNVVGYQSVQASNQKVINDEINQKELLFQTIADIANNKVIQRIILKSQISKEGFFNPGVRFSVFNHPVLTKKFLEHVYTIGAILSKTISKSKMHSLLERYKVSNQGMPKGINAVIEKDKTLKGEIMQLSSTTCDCGNENTTTWTFPVICEVLFLLWAVLLYFTYFGLHFTILWNIVSSLFFDKLNCWPAPPPPFQYFI